jgi:hypothetical protein
MDEFLIQFVFSILFLFCCSILIFNGAICTKEHATQTIENKLPIRTQTPVKPRRPSIQQQQQRRIPTPIPSPLPELEQHQQSYSYSDDIISVGQIEQALSETSRNKTSSPIDQNFTDHEINDEILEETQSATEPETEKKKPAIKMKFSYWDLSLSIAEDAGNKNKSNSKLSGKPTTSQNEVLNKKPPMIVRSPFEKKQVYSSSQSLPPINQSSTPVERKPSTKPASLQPSRTSSSVSSIKTNTLSSEVRSRTNSSNHSNASYRQETPNIVQYRQVTPDKRTIPRAVDLKMNFNDWDDQLSIENDDYYSEKRKLSSKTPNYERHYIPYASQNEHYDEAHDLSIVSNEPVERKSLTKLASTQSSRKSSNDQLSRKTTVQQVSSNEEFLSASRKASSTVGIQQVDSNGYIDYRSDNNVTPVNEPLSSRSKRSSVQSAVQLQQVSSNEEALSKRSSANASRKVSATLQESRKVSVTNSVNSLDTNQSRKGSSVNQVGLDKAAELLSSYQQDVTRGSSKSSKSSVLIPKVEIKGEAEEIENSKTPKFDEMSLASVLSEVSQDVQDDNISESNNVEIKFGFDKWNCDIRITDSEVYSNNKTNTPSLSCTPRFTPNSRGSVNEVDDSLKVMKSETNTQASNDETKKNNNLQMVFNDWDKPIEINSTEND